MIKKLTIFLFVLCVSFSALAVDPVLFFSDLDSGPKTGNSDGTGSGVIVTIWGVNLGSSQGTSKVYVGSVEATAVYYWKDADGSAPGGPADLNTYQNMQEVCFSVPAGASDGANTIKVTVDSTDSNTLPFTVRSGNIYFIKSGGSDAAAGSWSAPWATLANTFSNKLSAGSTVYSVGIGTSSGFAVDRTVGTSANPIALVAYPNSSVALSGSPGGSAVILNYNVSSSYVNLSKISITCAGNGVSQSPYGLDAIPYNRVVGVEITGPTVYGGYGGAITASGSHDNPPYGGHYLGLYIHDYGYRSTTPGLNNYSYNYSTSSGTWTDPPYNGIGDDCTNCTSMDRYQHLYYISIRQDNTNVPGYEIGWNSLINNPILHGIHIYDQGVSGSSFNTSILVHDNFVLNQGGAFFDEEIPYSSDIYVYNNVFVTESGKAWCGPPFNPKGQGHTYFYNNTVYGWRIATSSSGSSPTTVFRNNIFYDSLGVDYFSFTPATKSDNLFYSTQGTSNPSFYSAGAGDLNVDPDFNNAGSLDFSLPVDSPALDEGYNTSSVVTADFNGLTRDTSPSIGAFEYAEAEAPDTTNPSCTITTSDPSAIESDSLAIAGTASDAVGVSGVKWRIGSAPDATHGTACTGTTSWSATVTGFSEGANTLYVGAYDAAGNFGSDSITVNYTIPDTTDPVCTITAPTSSATYDNGAGSSVNIGGTASDNVEVSSIAWACPTCTPTSDTATGTTSWSESGIGLSSGDNVITVTATDSSSNTGQDVITITYTPAATKPACGISSAHPAMTIGDSPLMSVGVE